MVNLMANLKVNGKQTAFVVLQKKCSILYQYSVENVSTICQIIYYLREKLIDSSNILIHNYHIEGDDILVHQDYEMSQILHTMFE